MMKVQTNLSCYNGTAQMGCNPYKILMVVWGISYPYLNTFAQKENFVINMIIHIP
jgi:hypothetical protein